MPLKIEYNKIEKASYSQLQTIIEQASKELERRKAKDSLIPVYKVNDFGSICYYRCPIEAIESLSEALTDSKESPLLETWSAPEPEGVGRSLSVETIMMNKLEIEDKGRWWLG